MPTEKHIGIYVKYPLFLSDLKQNWNCSTNFTKRRSVKFHGNPLSVSQVNFILTDRRTDVANYFEGVSLFASFSPQSHGFSRIVEQLIWDLWSTMGQVSEEFCFPYQLLFRQCCIL